MTNAVNIASLGPAMTADSSGNVGIGTASPSVKLHVKSTANDVLMVESTNTYAFLDFTNPTGTAGIGNSGNFMRFDTGGSERMRIDSNGYVTTPYQPAFHASKSASPNATSENPVQYDTVEFNTGSCYSNSTYRFTAPVAGKYFITTQFSFYLSGGARQIEVGIKLNGGVWQETDTFMTQTQGNNTHCNATVAAVMNLSAGDYVQGAWIYSSAAVNFYSPGLRNSFSGFLIG